MLLVNKNLRDQMNCGRKYMLYLPGRWRVLLAASSGLRASSQKGADVRPRHRGIVPLTVVLRRGRGWCRRDTRARGMSIGFRFLLGLGFRLLRGAASFLVLVLLFFLLRLYAALLSYRRGLGRWWGRCTIT